MTRPELIADVFVQAAVAIADVESAVDHEPGNLPPMPAVTMLPRVPTQADAETGEITDVTWQWEVHLYLDLRDYERAQRQFYAIVPELLAITRHDPLLSDTCDHATLTAEGGDLEPQHDEGWLMARFRLTALTSEE